MLNCCSCRRWPVKLPPVSLTFTNTTSCTGSPSALQLFSKLTGYTTKYCYYIFLIIFQTCHLLCLIDQFRIMVYNPYSHFAGYEISHKYKAIQCKNTKVVCFTLVLTAQTVSDELTFSKRGVYSHRQHFIFTFTSGEHLMFGHQQPVGNREC